MPAETASSNHLTRTLQSSSQTQAILIVRTGISAVHLLSSLGKNDHLAFFFCVWISLDWHCLCGGISHTDLSPVAVFLLLRLPLQISLSVKAVTISTNFSPHFSWVLHDNRSLSVESLFSQSIQGIPCTHKMECTTLVA